MTDKPEQYDDEINLRDYIEVLIKRKMTILVVFLVCVVLAAFVSFNSPKVYQASASIMITPSKIQRMMSPSKISLEVKDNGATEEGLRAMISIPTHKELLKSNELLISLIDRLNLTGNRGKKIFPQSISGRLKIDRKKDTSIIDLYVKDSNPKRAQQIANAWADEYIEYTKKIIAGEIKGTGQIIQEQFDIALENLEKIEQKIQDFNAKNDTSLMKQELAIKKEKLGKEKRELVDIEMKLRVKKDTLKELEREITKHSQFITVAKAINDESLWQEALKSKNTERLDKKKLYSQQINPIYQDLSKRIADTNIEIKSLQPKIEYLRGSVSKTEREISALTNEIGKKELKLTKLTRERKLKQKTYDSLAERIEEAKMIKASQLDEVKIVSSAVLPKSSLKQGRKNKIFLSGILGLMLGVFAAFAREFWEGKQKS